MKTSRCSLLCIAALFMLMTGMPDRAHATVYFVDGTGGNDANDGSTWALAKKTITSALTTANADAQAASALCVKAGTYTITTTLTPNDARSLIGAGASDATKTSYCGGSGNLSGFGTGTSTITSSTTSLLSYVAGITTSTLIDGFTLANTTGYAIKCWPGSPTINNNIFSGNNFAAIATNGSSTAVISNNTISGAGTIKGIYVDDASPTIKNNTITGIGGKGIWITVSSSGTANPLISSNTISSNSSHGIYLLNYYALNGITTSPTIKNNTITGNSGSGLFMSISSLGSSATLSPIIKNNSITVNTQYGILISGDLNSSIASPVVSSNTITGNGFDGIYIKRLATGTSSSPDFGGGGSSIGANTIKNNSDTNLDGTGYDGTYTDFRNGSSVVVNAQNNWWNESPPSASRTAGAGTVTTTNPNDQALTFTNNASSGNITGGTLTLDNATSTLFVESAGVTSTAANNVKVEFGSGNSAAGVSTTYPTVDATGKVLTAKIPSGTGTVDIIVTNPAGHTGTLASGFTFGDSTVPYSASISINSAATTTTSTGVTLTLSASDDIGVVGYYVSESSATPTGTSTSVTSTTSFSASVSFTLSSGDGTKTVYAWFKDAGGNISAVASDTIYMDATAPTVSSVSPASGTTGVSVSTVISATFGETMASSTISTSTFTIDNGVTGTVSYSGNTATFTPSANLSYSTTYTATITTGVTDSYGNAIASNYTWSFTTETDPVATTASNSPPSSFSLVYPASGATGLGTGVNLIWNETTDPDGDAVTYSVYVCDNSSFSGCSAQTVAAVKEQPVGYASVGSYLFGIAIIGTFLGVRKKRFVILIAYMTVLAAVSGCGVGGDFTAGAPASGTTSSKVEIIFPADVSLKPGGRITVKRSVVATVTQITLSVTASGMDTITQNIPLDTLEVSLDVPAGNGRTFAVTVNTDTGTTYSGSETLDLIMGGSADISITLLLDPASGSGEVSHWVSGLNSGTVYYWKVVADDGNGGTTESSTWSFTTN